jgi:hypothetical protein
MIKELFVIVMVLIDGQSIVSINHATAHDSLNVFETLRECESELPDFVNSTYPEFDPQPNLLNHQVVVTGEAESPLGRRAATWRCTSIFIQE